MKFIAAFFVMMIAAGQATAEDEAFNISTPAGDLKVTQIAKTDMPSRSAIIVLSGSRGLKSPVYAKIAERFNDAGFDVYLPHLLTPKDLETIATAGGAAGRMAYYDTRRSDWITSLKAVVDRVRANGHSGGIGLLGISLGAETAAMATASGLQVDALVLVDGMSRKPSLPLRSVASPLHLIWGGADHVFPLASAKRFAEEIRASGGRVSMTVFDNAPHDVFLKADSRTAADAHRDATLFFTSTLAK